MVGEIKLVQGEVIVGHGEIMKGYNEIMVIHRKKLVSQVQIMDTVSLGEIMVGQS